MRKHFDTGSMIVIIITFVLFIMALFTKGFTQDLLLEAGVFLVSMKLIMMAYYNSVYIKSIENEMNYPAAELRGIKMNFYLINPDAEHRGILLINLKTTASFFCQ